MIADYEVRTKPDLTVLGIFTRASNAAPEKIGDLWRRMHAMGDEQAFPMRRNDSVFCVYCEFEGDWTQPYTVVLGCEVDSGAEVPEDRKKVAIPAGKFAVFPVTLDGQPLPLYRKWLQVWETPLERRYASDYDRYEHDGTAAVYVGVQ